MDPNPTKLAPMTIIGTPAASRAPPQNAAGGVAKTDGFAGDVTGDDVSVMIKLCLGGGRCIVQRNTRNLNGNRFDGGVRERMDMWGLGP